MKVGDYVRIVNDLGKQYIGKIYNINEYREPSMKYAIDCQIFNDFAFVGEERIYKSSPNIIDLIEVGDYVNGHKVLDIAQAPKKALYLNDISQKCALIPVYDYQIKSIVTKEQFESMEYKVGE